MLARAGEDSHILFCSCRYQMAIRTCKGALRAWAVVAPVGASVPARQALPTQLPAAELCLATPGCLARLATVTCGLHLQHTKPEHRDGLLNEMPKHSLPPLKSAWLLVGCLAHFATVTGCLHLQHTKFGLRDASNASFKQLSPPDCTILPCLPRLSGVVICRHKHT